jgi:hypothetical protein
MKHAAVITIRKDEYGEYSVTTEFDEPVHLNKLGDKNYHPSGTTLLAAIAVDAIVRAIETDSGGEILEVKTTDIAGKDNIIKARKE